MDVYFAIGDTTTVQEIDVFLYDVFSTRQKVILHLSLVDYTKSYFELFVFKKVLDKYRDYSKKYIMYTNITINNTFVVLVLELLVMFFKPENPVFFDEFLSDRQSRTPTRTLSSGP